MARKRNAAAAALARKRARSLTRKRRSEIARAAARGRWGKVSTKGNLFKEADRLHQQVQGLLRRIDEKAETRAREMWAEVEAIVKRSI